MTKFVVVLALVVGCFLYWKKSHAKMMAAVCWQAGEKAGYTAGSPRDTYEHEEISIFSHGEAVMFPKAALIAGNFDQSKLREKGFVCVFDGSKVESISAIKE